MGSVPTLQIQSIFATTVGDNPSVNPGDIRCRCLYGYPCWPTEDDFAQLSSRLSRPLIQPTPLAQPCYLPGIRSATNGPLKKCSVIAQKWDHGPWRFDHAGAMQDPNFETHTNADGTLHACVLNASLGTGRCEQGSVPVIGVDARTVHDIQAAVKFAAKHYLRLVIKNTGHNFLGRSSGKGSFMIWTHHMKDVFVHDVFRPLEASANENYYHAITLGAGVQWQEAYAAADAAGRMIVGGISAGGSVGAAGGWLLGGGYSALSPTYGLGVDNVLEVFLVTANGGGGGTYGIVTSVTYRTYSIVPVKIAFVVATAFAELVRVTPTLTDAGWGGYAGISADGPRLSHTSFALIPNVSWEQANAAIVPYLDRVRGLAHEPSALDEQSEPAMTVTTQPASFSSFYSAYNAILPDTRAVGQNLELGSWLLPAEALKDYKSIAQTLVPIPGFNYELVAEGAVSRTDPSSTGLNPAWRQAVAHAVFGTTWPDGTSPKDIVKLRLVLRERTAEVRALAPDSGAYFNEVSRVEIASFISGFSEHHCTGINLKAIKESYDPVDIFMVREGVRSEHWDEELRCMLD
ncbi:FAD-binding domain-containing protein [Trametes coccinea BRFM310]|uniref:FAD-binding domain-containing protein n=1 Tax=Trametes coccinea (strain BRFM310) TaxID=1353009 RepID=A0A1Y2J3M9_TRAC3|nr:FAD-binding domain-containing protein [Trametes coccinea BRFM310]